MDLEKKLKEFEESCLGIASKEAMELKKEIEQEIENQMKTELDEYNQRKEWNYNKTIEKLEKDYMKEVFKIQTDCKKEILNAKNEIYKDLKLEVINRIKEFTSKNEYKNFLLQLVKQSLEYTNSEDDIILGLTKSDLEKYKSDILNIRDVSLKEIDDKYIGGCIIESDNIFIDNSLINNIEEKMID